MEKSFTLNFLDANPSINFDSEYTWKPATPLNHLSSIKTASFCGKNQADDYQSE